MYGFTIALLVISFIKDKKKTKMSLKKGVKFSNILIFIGAWSTTKIPMFLFEVTSLGAKFAFTRLLVDIPGIIIIAYVLSKLVSNNEIKEIYENAELINK